MCDKNEVNLTSFTVNTVGLLVSATQAAFVDIFILFVIPWIMNHELPITIHSSYLLS